ncbi:(E)-4-hydroxy-3-methylbut-2-enyl-diphosphate synthase [Dysgonomonadaceae bacterium PH5-43]|nr:(E)-4-hydroxy-3-methylbut-2-enyl-diphosphate synthase [Dysgonomonadaceae bacterium PH5-43]
MSFNYSRRQASVTEIGNTPLGGSNPIRIQSMTNTSTMDTDACIKQAIAIIESGGEYVRLTTQGVREAENLKYIKQGLNELGYHTPLVADVHFNPKAAEAAAHIIEKVRINPGNFADPVKTFKTFEYSNEEYQLELEKIRERFIPLLNICKEHNTAIRIGVNHGSLSDRIMSRYGDTPQGMVESCMEFLRICIDENFTNIVISIKASNSFVMVRTVRLLVDQMGEEGMNFPLHLGVTEAGEGEDGRIKSAVGIGTLLLEGIGDTIRVSLSENPEKEIPVARSLVEYVNEKAKLPTINQELSLLYNKFNPQRKKTIPIYNIGGENVPIVISDRSEKEITANNKEEITPDYIYVGAQFAKNRISDTPIIVDADYYIDEDNTYPLFNITQQDSWITHKGLCFVNLTFSNLDNKLIETLKEKNNTVIIINSESDNIYEQKAFIHKLMDNAIQNPVVIKTIYQESELEQLQIKSSVDNGSFFLDMLADGIMISNKNTSIPAEVIDECAFGILQATGRRIFKTEYISCPGCGRTLFDLHSAIRKVKTATSHLKGMKIAIMGCIVNGPGEMADADYGYVGAGVGKVSLYKGKECVLKNIPEEEAVDALIDLISKQTTR